MKYKALGIDNEVSVSKNRVFFFGVFNIQGAVCSLVHLSSGLPIKFNSPCSQIVLIIVIRDYVI